MSNEQITEIISILSPISQQFSKPNEFESNLLQSIEDESFADEEFIDIKNWAIQLVDDFEGTESTDEETSSEED